MRKFPAQQLLSVETELDEISTTAANLAMDVGDHSDELHWDAQEMKAADRWIAQAESLRHRLDRVEGLLRAYEMFRNAT
jgi:hypothetical protein